MGYKSEQDKAFETPDEVWNSFKDHLLTVADKHAPVVTRRVRGKTLPWLTPETKNLMQEREHFHKKAIKTNKEIHWSSYKRLRNAVTLKLRKEKSRYYSTRLSEDQNSKEMWKTLKKILPKKPKTAAEIENLSATKSVQPVFYNHSWQFMWTFYRPLTTKSTYTQSWPRIHSSTCEPGVCITGAAQTKINKSHQTRRNFCKAVKGRSPRSSQTYCKSYQFLDQRNPTRMEGGQGHTYFQIWRKGWYQ